MAGTAQRLDVRYIVAALEPKRLNVVKIKALSLATGCTAPLLDTTKSKPLIKGEGTGASIFPRPAPMNADMMLHPAFFSRPVFFEPSADLSLAAVTVVRYPLFTIERVIGFLAGTYPGPIAAVTPAVTQSVFNSVS